MEYCSLPLFYNDNFSRVSNELSTANVCYVDKDFINEKDRSYDEKMYYELAFCGDSKVSDCLNSGVDTSPDMKEPSTIKQVFALPDREQLREVGNVEINMIKKKKKTYHVTKKDNTDASCAQMQGWVSPAT